MNTVLARVNQFIETRITQNEPNIVGRFGLYRIFYAVFYLWIIAHYNYRELALIPAGEWQPLLPLLWTNAPPNAGLLALLEVLLVGGLVLLLVGYQTRLATAVILVTGIILTTTRYSFGKIDHYDTFMIAYTPFVMLFYNWGKIYSIDALLRARLGEPVSDPTDSRWQEAWPLLIILFMIVVLFTTGGILKLLPDRNSWLWHVNVIRKVTFEYNKGMNPNPLAGFIYDTPLIYGSLRFAAVFFETFFFLALVNNKWRTFFVSSAVLFHLYNLLFNGITFLDMLIIYALFIDWQALYSRWWPKVLKPQFERLATPILIAGSVSLAIIIALVWSSSYDSITRTVLRIIPVQPVWALAAVIALYSVVRSGWNIMQDILAFLRRGNKWNVVPQSADQT